MTLRRWSGPGSGFGRSPAIRGTSRSPRPRTSLAPERSPWSSPVGEIRVGQGFDVHRVAPARDQIRRSLAAVLGVSPERVSVKATRPEGLGLTGDGVGCLALALMQAR